MQVTPPSAFANSLTETGITSSPATQEVVSGNASDAMIRSPVTTSPAAVLPSERYELVLESVRLNEGRFTKDFRRGALHADLRWRQPRTGTAVTE
jgi:hypothetical protein